MLRRRTAQLAEAGLRALLQDSRTAGSTAGIGRSSWAIQPAVPACGSSSSSSSSSTWLRWRHNLGAAGRGSGGRVGSAAGRSSPHQQQQRAAAANVWRVSSWQQIRQQWSDGRGYQHFRGRGQPAYAFLYNQQARRRALIVTGVVGGVGLVVWVSSQQEVPYTRRSHAILIGPETELELGKQTFQQVLMQARAEGSLLAPGHRATQSVRRIGMRIAQAATDGYGGGYQGHLRHLEWEFAVIDSPQVNAFVVPGGKVVVYTGLLRMVANEDELAGVLAHESAHVVARHAAERITQMGVLEVVRMIVYWAFGVTIPGEPLSAIFFLPNSRKAEIEADVIGVQIMSRACFDPTAMVSMFEKMGRAEKAEGGDRMPKFLRTHPVSSDRIKAIQKMLPTAEGLYEMSGCDAARGSLQRFRSMFRPVDW